MEIVKMTEERQVRNAHSLILDVFRQCCAEDFSPEGKRCFLEGNSLDLFLDGFFKGPIVVWGCFLDGELRGVAQIYQPNHFVNLFVDPKYQSMGIGKKLFWTVVESCKKNGVSFLQLEALPSSLRFCQRLGCIPSGEAISLRGLTYSPMIFPIP